MGEERAEAPLVKPTLLVQSQVVSSQGDGLPGEANAVPALKFRRVRPGLEVRLLEDRLRTELVVSALPGDLELVEAHTSFDLSETLTVQVGQFKIPFMRYRMNSGTRLVLVDWAFHTEYIGGERQVGVAIGNDEHATGIVRYKVGLFTGQNARNSHGLGIARLYGSPTPEPASLVDEERVPYEGFERPEVASHLGFALGGIDPSTLDDLARGDRLRAYIGLGLTVNLAPRRHVEHRMRGAIEGMFKWRGWGLYTSAYVATNSSYYFQDSIEPFQGYHGVMGSMSYRLSGLPISVGARTSWLGVDDQVMTDASIRAHDGGVLDFEATGSLREHTAGLRWDAHEDLLSLATDVGAIEHRGEVRGEEIVSRGWLARLQFQLRL